MAAIQSTSVRAARVGILQSLVLLGASFVPWKPARELIDSARSPELNRAEREQHAAGYYEGLIGGGEGAEGARGELALRLMGKPSGWVQFSDANVSRLVPDDFLQFELLPGIRRMLFGKPFVTNSHGMHSAEVSLEKPADTFRIAVLGASMDMGWGVTYQETYSHQLQEWLNRHGDRRGLGGRRRFEVLNFAVAAYSPLQRLESFRRQARAFRPDLVIYSATLLDRRLTEIHLCEAVRHGADLTYPFLEEFLDESGIEHSGHRVEGERLPALKGQIKEKLATRYWDLYDRTIGALAGECRATGVPLLMVIVPRVGKADAPPARAEPVAHLKAIADHHAVPLFDLTDTYDRHDPATLEIAAWDDHPNALGHHRLFLALGRALSKSEPHYRLLFPEAFATGASTATPHETHTDRPPPE
ncbi:MAG: hypothetical protein U0790_26360 [Isosphaeraceae bacterium]